MTFIFANHLPLSCFSRGSLTHRVNFRGGECKYKRIATTLIIRCKNKIYLTPRNDLSFTVPVSLLLNGTKIHTNHRHTPAIISSLTNMEEGGQRYTKTSKNQLPLPPMEITRYFPLSWARKLFLPFISNFNRKFAYRNISRKWAMGSIRDISTPEGHL